MNIKKTGLLDLWPLFFLLTFLEAAVAFYALLRIPSEGISVLRLALLTPLALALIFSGLAAYIAWKKPEFRRVWLSPDSHPRLFRFLSVAFPLLATATGIGAFLLRWWDPARLLPFFERAWPLLAFIIAFSIQSSLWLLAVRFGFHKTDTSSRKPAFVTFIILLFVFAFISLTKLGVTPDPAYWGEPGVAIQGWQLGLALIVGGSFLPLSFTPFFKSRRTDFIIGALIWVLAAGIWISTPNEVLKNSFYFPIDPPTNIPLPYSDSGYYDSMAHSLLIGTDYMGEIPTRPLYIVFLTILHLFLGENYNLIINAQTLVLAAFPVLFYLIGTKLHSRIAGVTIALLAIFRDFTSMLVASDTRVSNAKFMLVDTPTLLLILLACLSAFLWLKRKDKRSAFITGGIFGVLLLLRTQSMLILPFLFIVAFMAMRSQSPRSQSGFMIRLVPFLIFGLGIAISIMPWLTHNYIRIGRFAFDAPFQYQVLASQYAYTGNLDYGAIDLEGKSLGQILITFMIKDPGFVLGFITNHFLATEVGGILALPLFYPFNGLREPINIYWTSFNGTLPWHNILLIIGYLAIIAIGIGASWKRWRWAGLLPLAFNLGYATANGIGRFSGWRYDLPADWIAFFYLGIGCAEILFWLSGTFGFTFPYTNHTIESEKSRNPTTRLISIAAIFVLVGFIPWIAETVNPPPRYSDSPQAVLQTQIANLQSVEVTKDIQVFSNQPKVVILNGRLLYPRTFGSNAGLSSSTPWPSYAPRDYSRLGFKLLNDNLIDIVFPNKGVTIGNVQGSDVIVLGCQLEHYVEARLLIFPNEGITYLSDRELESCPQ